MTPTSTPIVVTGRVPSAIVTNKTQEEKTTSTLENAEFLNDTPANNQSGSKTPTEAPNPATPKPEDVPASTRETYGTSVPEEQQTQNVYTGAQPVTKVEASDANIRVQPANIIMAINVYNTLRDLDKEKTGACRQLLQKMMVRAWMKQLLLSSITTRPLKTCYVTSRP